MKYKSKLLLLFTVCILLLVSISCKNEKEEKVTREELQEKEGIPVEVVTVKRGDIFITVDVSGDLKADDAVTVSTDNSGTINEVYIKEGQYVNSGQTIAVIEPDDLEDQTFQAQAFLNAAYMRLSQAESNAVLISNQIEGAIRQAEASVKAAEAQYIQSLAALEASKEQLSLIEEGARTQEIAQAEQAVVQVEANFKEVELDLGRMERLYDKGAIGKQQLEVAQVQYDVAEAQYKAALEQLDLVKEGARTQEIAAAKQQVKISEANSRAALATLEQAKEGLDVAISNRLQVTVANQAIDVSQADVEQAKANLSMITRKLEKSFVKAPISGYVTELYVEAGEHTKGQGTTDIIDVFDPESLYFEGVISETDIVNVTEGLTVDISVDGVPGKTFTGYIKEIVPKASESRQFTVRIIVNEVGTDLKPGMFARGAVLLSSHEDVIVISKNTIKEKDGATYVFTVEDLHAVQKEVITGPSMNGDIEISRGLEAGEKVVYAGAVKDGDLVKIIKENE